jgi:hypothetical protein
MTVDPRTDIADPQELRDLWTGLLLAPAAFLLNLEMAYALVPQACSSGTRLLTHVVHAVCLVLTILGGLTALRRWRLHGETWPGGGGGRVSRSRFMSGLGLLLSGFIAMVIVAQWIPSFVLTPCD